MTKLSLKTQNILPLSMLILFQCALAYALALSDSADLNDKLLTRASSVLLLMGTVTGWLSFLLPAGVKNALVFLRITKALPGHRFVQLCADDPRIDIEYLKSVTPEYEALTADPVKQNQYWYNKIYRPLVDNREVASAHKAFLLYRDAAAVSIILIVCMVVAGAFISSVRATQSVSFVMAMVVCCFGFLTAANFAGKRFVTTTVAIYLAGGPKKTSVATRRKKLDKVVKDSGDE